MATPACSSPSTYSPGFGPRSTKYGTKRLLREGVLLFSFFISGWPMWAQSGSPASTNSLVSIAVTPANPSIAAGYTRQFTATAVFSNGSRENVTNAVWWSSSAPGVATINAAGLVTSLTPGTAMITAALPWEAPAKRGAEAGVIKHPLPNPPPGGLTGSTKLTVTSPVLVSITVTPANASLVVGSTEQFSATGTYSNGSTQDLTSTAAWSSSATGVATISETGLASTVEPGKTTIAAASATVSGSTGFTVTAGFVLTGSLNIGREEFTATLLTNGLVLIAGGYNSSYPYLTEAELFDPTAGTFTATGSLNTPRESHTATGLNNGQVLIAGGYNSSGSVATAELYNPSTGIFTLTGSLNFPRNFHTATLLNDGRVLIAGGDNSHGSGDVAGAELYDPATGTFALTGSLNTARESHTATLLNDGRVLIAGGGGSLSGAELYDPATGTFTVTGSLNTPRTYHRATLLNDATVLITGGVSGYEIADASEIYDPAIGAFTDTTGSLNIARVEHTATLLNNGQVLLAGGAGWGGNQASAELYDPATQTFTLTGSMNTAHYRHRAALLTNGLVLVAGGEEGEYDGYLTIAELYEPATLTPPNLVSISVTPSTPTLPLNTAVRFIATGAFGDGSAEQLASVTWSSSNPEVISIGDDSSNPGWAYAATEGSATISACAGGVCGSTMATAGSPSS